MSSSQPTQQQLEALVVQCPELHALEIGLRRFNIFSVLRATNNELRHSNILAWLLQPNESHGLGDRFLRRWLMNLVRGATRERAPTLAEIDSAEIRSVEVLREWRHIDVLVRIRLHDEEHPWIIAIENKVDATQGDDQLATYRRRVDDAFSDARRLLVFLTMFEEEPADGSWISADYATLAAVLRAVVDENSERVGSQPRVLIENYLQTVREHAMGDDKLNELAKTIYRTHQAALDFIYEQREDPLLQLSTAVQERATRASVVRRVSDKRFVRFLPNAWDVPKNTAGAAWGPEDSAYLLCEIALANKEPALKIVAARTPDEWRQKLHQTALTIGTTKAKISDTWLTVFSRKLHAATEETAEGEFAAAADKIWASCEAAMKAPDFQAALAAFTPLLDELPDPTRGFGGVGAR